MSFGQTSDEASETQHSRTTVRPNRRSASTTQHRARLPNRIRLIRRKTRNSRREVCYR